ncbi:MAG: CoxG family protein [Candidatus Bathyarchaeia archaeon]
MNVGGRIGPLKFETAFNVNVSRQRAWDVLLDAESIYTCIEGCERIEPLGEDKYKAAIKIGISFLKAKFAVDVAIVDKTPPAHAKTVISGKDNTLGSTVEATMLVDLDEISPQETRIQWSAEINLTGKIASLGHRVIGPIADKKIAAFVECVKKKVSS